MMLFVLLIDYHIPIFFIMHLCIFMISQGVWIFSRVSKTTSESLIMFLYYI